MKKLIIAIILTLGLTNCTKEKLVNITSTSNEKTIQPISFNPVSTECLVEIDFIVSSPNTPTASYSINNTGFNFTPSGQYKTFIKAKTQEHFTFYKLTFNSNTIPNYTVTIKENGVIKAQEIVPVNTIPTPLTITL